MLDRNREIARRCGDLSPIAGQVRTILLEGNKAVLLAGVSPGSTRPVAPLAPSTLARRKGNGPPRVPMGSQSRAVRDCVVDVRAGKGSLTFAKSYPTLGPIAEYLDRGTKKMPARPFMEYRRIDLENVGKLLREHVIPQTFLGRVRGWFGR